MISFEEYEKIIQAGCSADGGRISARSPPSSSERRPPITTYDSEGSVIYL